MNMKKVTAGLISIFCLAFVGTASSQPLSDPGKVPPDYSHGKALYRDNCRVCHGVNGNGNGPVGASMYPPPADFTNPQFWRNTNREQIANTIQYGRGRMPAFRSFSSADIQALIDYISHFEKSGISGTGSGYGGYGMGPGMMGPGYGRGYGMGPGMMGGYGRGYGMGRGMMGPGYGYGYEPQYRLPSKPLTEKDAGAEVEDYLKSIGNPNLKVGRITDKGNAFEVEVLTKDDSLVDKFLVDKNTGWMKSAY
jgi:mono/diheme cytochrome c family protein